MPTALGIGSPLALDARARDELASRLGEAVRLARRHGEALAALTVAVDPFLDPVAVVAASRRADEPFWWMEQPDRDGQALATLGCVRAIDRRGPGRFTTVASQWRALADHAVAERPSGPPGSGLVAVGGFAFAPQGGQAPHWAGFPPASLHVPEVAFARRGDDVRMTVAVRASPDDLADELLARAVERVEALRVPAGLPLLDPSPTARVQVSSLMAPEHFEHAVARAAERIREGRDGIEKVVLAREVAVHVGHDHDPAAVHGVLREAFRGCFVFACGRADATFVAATPELLVRREGGRVSTLALAGSARRSADPSVDDHLGEGLLRSDKDREEHAIVVRRIERALRPWSVWVTSAPEPVLAQMANIQHLATPIRAQLAAPHGAIELAGLLHPTPAVGGEPEDVALPLIPALEGLDRGWYAGPVGWTDLNEDGELCVALRCALLRGREARCYAGVGVVGDSDPASELAETEMKLGALLPVLAG